MRKPGTAICLREFCLPLPHACITPPASAFPPTFSRNPLAYLAYLVTPYTASEREGLRFTREVDATGRAYFQEQATKPQTIGYSLADSPIGILAWIYEKLVAWTDAYPWTDDEGQLC